jgi:hypothetical protein
LDRLAFRRLVDGRRAATSARSETGNEYGTEQRREYSFHGVTLDWFAAQAFEAA